MNACMEHGRCVVVYDGLDCPICGLQTDLEDSESKVDSLKDELENLKADYDELKNSKPK